MTEIEWERKINDRKIIVGILGLGYIGLPLAREFTAAGFHVIGFDIIEKKVRTLNSGRSTIKHIPHSQIRKMVNSNFFKATTKMEYLKTVDAVIVCIPTPLTQNREPDMQFIKNSSETIAKYLKVGQLIIFESTTYPGTTREFVMPILENSGLTAGKDFHLAYSPEREDPGNKIFTIKTIPKIVSGLTNKCLKMACRLYKSIVEKVIPVNSLEIAEAAKILENVYRYINIALINELKTIFDEIGIDVWKVIAAASTKPFGFSAFYPGPGSGGPCIPINPFYLIWKARKHGMTSRFIEVADEINKSIPNYIITKMEKALNRKKKLLEDSKVLVLGLAYKKDIDDPRESPSIELIQLLHQKGVKVDYNDPYIPKTQLPQHNLRLNSKRLSAKMLSTYDVVLILTNHSNYNYDLIVKNAKLIVDTRNAVESFHRGKDNIIRA